MTSDGTSAAQQFYGQWAGLYDGLCRYTPGLDSIRERAVAALDLQGGETVVEMGCGTGANLSHLREQVGPNGRVVGVDVTRGMLAQARKRIDRGGWENVEVLQGDATHSPVAAPVDAVLATFVVGMFDDPGEIVERWIGALAPGGRIALLDAAPRRKNGPLDAAFRAFVVASAPPTTRFRYEESPASILDQRVEYAHHTLISRASDPSRGTLARGFVRMAAGTNPRPSSDRD